MITISFYSYKGGVGRSLALTNLGVYLAQFGATVVMVDFDLEAPGLQYKIRPGSPLALGQGGLANLLANASSGMSLSDLNYDIAIDVTEHVEPPPVAEEDLEQPHGRLLLIPAGDPLQPQYWKDLAGIDWFRLFTEKPRPGVAALAKLRRHVIEKYDPDVLLIDSRTGITPSGGVSTTLLPDVVVMFLLNTDEHLDGSRIVVSAIAQSATADRAAPRVVPVLSRYTAEDLTGQMGTLEMRRRGVHSGRYMPDAESTDENIPLHMVRTALVRGLDEDIAESVAAPLVLHADVALQQRERLSFGPYALEGANGLGEALLDDYLRLFASLVPSEMVSRYLSGVRSRVRGIILDRPDDAVRTLENLAALVGDEAVFVDLVKVHVLRRDVRSMLLAADRLHKVHGRIVVHPAISRSLREMLVSRSRGPGELPNLRADFLEDYWLRAAPNDLEWGAAIARALVARGLVSRADAFGEEILERMNDASALVKVVGALVGGDAEAGMLAARLALRHFELGESSIEFLRAASVACRHEPNAQLAERIIASPAFSAMPDAVAIDVFVAADRYTEAGVLLIETLAVADPRESSIARLVPSWVSLAARNKELRLELQQRNPRIIEMLDSLAEDLSSREKRRFGL